MSMALYAGSQRSSQTVTGRSTRHSFSFGPHYDPANLGFGPLVCHNDDLLDPGAGYAEHPHAELEIVTWVLEGALVHTDSTGARHVLEAGHAQRLSAGTGIRHSEVADLRSGRCRFVQAWLTPNEAGGEPSYVRGEAPQPGGGLTEVVGGHGLPIGTRGARLLVARLDAGESVALPEDPHQHVFAATGSVDLAGVPLRAGDAVRLTDEPGHVVRADEPTELLVWSFAGQLRAGPRWSRKDEVLSRDPVSAAPQPRGLVTRASARSSTTDPSPGGRGRTKSCHETSSVSRPRVS